MKLKLSDWTVITLGTLGFVLGLIGLCDPESQYGMMGIKAASLPPGSIISGLFGSGSLSALYVGIMYIYGVLKKWNHFKAYLVFARIIMCLGFLALVCAARAPREFVPAAVWEGVGALLILVTLWVDGIRKRKPQR